jgi:hypothetical protein
MRPRQVQRWQQRNRQPGGDQGLRHRDIVGRVVEPRFKAAVLEAELPQEQGLRAPEGCAAPTRLG